MHELEPTRQSNNKAYTGQIAPSFRQAPFQSVAAQIKYLQLHQKNISGHDRAFDRAFYEGRA